MVGTCYRSINTKHAPAPADGLAGPQVHATNRGFSSWNGHFVQCFSQQATGRINLVLNNPRAQQFAQIVDRHGRGNLPQARLHFLRGEQRPVVLIHQLPHQLFQNVFHGDQAGNSAVLVDHKSKVRVRRLHYPQLVVRPLHLGNESSGAGQITRQRFTTFG